MKRRLGDFTNLTPAEECLRDEIGFGRQVTFGDGEHPDEEAGPDRTVTAAFLRYLMMGGCADLPMPVPETGVLVSGARITGVLDLEGARCPNDLGLINCVIEETPILRSAEIDGLYLNGSSLPGLDADSARLRGGLFLRRAALTAELRLLGARIGGDLSCTGATLKGSGGGDALSADRVQVEGGVFLRGGFTATGAVRLLGARIGGNIDCEGATLKGSGGGDALLADGATVSGALFLRGDARITGMFVLTGARIGLIADEAGSWPGVGKLVLDRCRYGAFVGTDVTAEARLEWLGLERCVQPGQEFKPQPWEHCAKVLREMGHGVEATEILIDKERRLRAARRARMSEGWRRLWTAGDWLMAVTTRYGRRPMLAFLWLLGFWAAGAGIFFAASQLDALKPNNAFVLRSPEWAACAPGYVAPSAGPAKRGAVGLSQLGCFRKQPEAAAYPEFNALIYSADTLLPIVAMEMQEFWIPDERHPFGRFARGYLWAHIAFGWALSLLAVAGFSGLIKTDSA